MSHRYARLTGHADAPYALAWTQRHLSPYLSNVFEIKRDDAKDSEIVQAAPALIDKLRIAAS
jgi:hypothetical protein